jgi:hypothetical protein
MVGKIEPIRQLQSFLMECVEQAERHLGLRDKSFLCPQVRVLDVKSPRTIDSDPPNLWVDIPARSLCSDDLTEARWHVAHESIHVLDPHKNPTSYLEEGLATWFQNKEVSQYCGPQSNPWYDAMKRVNPWIEKGLLAGLSRFRQEQANLRRQGKPSIKLGDITKDMLIFYCPALRGAVSPLIEAFPAFPTPEEVPRSSQL